MKLAKRILFEGLYQDRPFAPHNESTVLENIQRSIAKATHVLLPPNPGSLTNLLPTQRYAVAPYPLCWLESEQDGYRFGVLMETFDCRPNEVGNLKSVHAFVVVEDRKPRLIGKCYYTIGHDFHMKPPVDVRWDTYFESSLFTTRLVGNIIGGIHLLSIKNIQLEDRPGDTSVPKVLRKRFGINKGYQYKILVVKKPGKQNQNKLGQDLREFPLHSVRSHIKRYGPDKPLFGKYIGEYLWKAHARGDEKHGVVDKDYEVRGDE